MIQSLFQSTCKESKMNSVQPFILQDMMLEKQQQQSMPINENTLVVTDRDVDEYGNISLPSGTVMSHIRASEFTMMNELYNVDEGRDSIILFEYPPDTTPAGVPTAGFSSIEVRIPFGQYDLVQLCATLSQYASLTSQATGRDYQYEFTMQSPSYKCVITAKSRVAQTPQFISIGHTRLSRDVLGFTLAQNAVVPVIEGIPNRILVSDNIMNSSPMSALVLRADIATQNKHYFGSGLTMSLMSIPLLSAFGNTMSFKSSLPYLYLGNNQSVSRINLKFLNGDSLNSKDVINRSSPPAEVNFRGARWVLTLHYH